MGLDMNINIKNLHYIGIGIITMAMLLENLFVPGFAGAASVKRSLAAGNNHTMFLASDGTVWAWGVNNAGQLGNGKTVNSSSPVQINALSGKTITAVSAGKAHSLALAADGTVWAWGENENGQLGDGTTIDRSTPVKVQGLNGRIITAIDAGASHNLALAADGTVWAWGNNNYGQLGDGSLLQRNTPAQVSSANWFNKTIIAVSAGGNHSLSLDSDGVVWAWGYNQDKQLGIPGIAFSNTPQQVSAQSGITAIAAGGSHSLALKGGQVLAWGLNNYGQLGDGTNLDRTTPVLLPIPNGITALAAGENHSLAVAADGAVSAWGLNSCGQLGDGSTVNRNTPVPVSNISNITGIAAGQNHSAALERGSITAWGLNNYGQLGDGTAVNRSTPALAQGDGIISIAANGLAEDSLDGAQLTLEISFASFNPGLNPGQFTLNNAPSGTGINTVIYKSDSYCELILSYDGTDFHKDINNFSINVAAGAVSNGKDITTLRTDITALEEPCIMPCLEEKNLNGYVLPIKLLSDSFQDSSLDRSNFILNHAPTGLSIASVVYSNVSNCLVTLAYDGTDFANDIDNFSLTIKGEELTGGKDYTSDQATIKASAVPTGTGKYKVIPAADSIYTSGTDAGITIMTVNSGVSGFKYFNVDVVSSEIHIGNECMVFIHLRNNQALSLNAVYADFDAVVRSKAGFDVQPGDVIKVYMVDDLTNDINFNPTILQ